MRLPNKMKVLTNIRASSRGNTRGAGVIRDNWALRASRRLFEKNIKEREHRNVFLIFKLEYSRK